MATLNFDARTVAPDDPREVLPPGWYNVTIDESEMKPTKDGSGAYLSLRYSVLDGQFAGRKIFQNLNLRNNNATTVEIAYKQLSGICHAVGLLTVQDSSQLHGLPFQVRVKIRKDPTGQYEDQNDVSGYKVVGAAAGAGAAPAATPPPGWAGAAPQQPPAAAPQQYAPPPAAPAPTGAGWPPPAPPQAAPVAPQQPAAAPAAAPPWAGQQQAAPVQQPPAAPAAAAPAAPAAAGAPPPWAQQG